MNRITDFKWLEKVIAETFAVSPTFRIDACHHLLERCVVLHFSDLSEDDRYVIVQLPEVRDWWFRIWANADKAFIKEYLDHSVRLQRQSKVREVYFAYMTKALEQFYPPNEVLETFFQLNKKVSGLTWLANRRSREHLNQLYPYKKHL